DTWKPEVVRAALAAGAAMINDVSGLRDARLADECAAAGAALVVMHTRAEPKVKDFPGYDDVVADVVAFLRERIEQARVRGVGERPVDSELRLDDALRREPRSLKAEANS